MIRMNGDKFLIFLNTVSLHFTMNQDFFANGKKRVQFDSKTQKY